MADVRRLVELSMVPPLASEVASQIAGAVAAKSQVAALTGVTVTATTGTLPTANGSVTIANAATPTVTELQEFCVELDAKLDAVIAALKA
jgi:hypothetical protein